MPRSLALASILLALTFVGGSLVGCGMPRIPDPDSRASTEGDEDDYVDEEEDDTDEDEEDEEAGGDDGVIDAAALRDELPPVELGEAVAVPGTGVTMRPPEGSQRIPFGAGFLAMRHRIQISVVVAEGSPSLLDAVRAQGGAQAHGEPETVTISGQEGRIGRDRIRTQAGALERSWLLVHDGTRGLAVVATYEVTRAEQAWPAMREALTGVTWDRETPIDPAVALGIQVGDIEGLTLSRATTANVVLLGPGASFPPQPGQPVVTISPLPMQLASEQSARVCEQLVARLLPVPSSDIQLEGAIENGPLPGCERLATAEAEGQRLATYAAIVFTSNTPILVTGTVDATQVRRWRPRFVSAARSIRPRS
jgi:hypothetical protein